MAGAEHHTQVLKTFATQARKCMRTDSGGYSPDLLHALAQRRVEVDAKEIRIKGSKSELLRTIVAALSAKTAGLGVSSFVPKWRAREDSNSQQMSSRHLKGDLVTAHLVELEFLGKRYIHPGGRTGDDD